MAFATQVKRRRGTTAENDAFAGAEGEIVVDTEKHELRVHDGVTQGGFIIGSDGILVASQMPSDANNYTWFRKYSDGYVEQGGLALSSTVTYPVPLSSWSYPEYNSLYNNTGPAPYFDIGQITSQTGTGFNKGGNTKHFVWRIVGMAAN